MGERDRSVRSGRRDIVDERRGRQGLPLQQGSDGRPRCTDSAFYPYNAYSDAYAINDNDQIVGESSSHAFLWQDGVLHDLNDLLADGYAHWMIVRATGIDDAGQIAARGCPDLQLIQCSVVRLDPEGDVPAVSRPTSVEFYNAALDHYFMTASPDDAAVLDTGRLAGWRRTGGQFNVWTSGDPQSSPVCRYYIPPRPCDSHLFSASARGMQHRAHALSLAGLRVAGRVQRSSTEPRHRRMPFR